jgi:hypothetical protein
LKKIYKLKLMYEKILMSGNVDHVDIFIMKPWETQIDE